MSIITPTFNSSKKILRTIESINNQNYNNFEHIVIDGGSIDNTIDLVKNFSKYPAQIFSDRDKGIYDAMNKGLKKVNGEFVAILNSDDFFIDENVLKEVVSLFELGADIVYGGITYCNIYGEKKSSWIPTEFKAKNYIKGWHTPHPAFFARTSLYKRKGLFDLNYKIAADFDLMLRFMEDKSVNSIRLPRSLVMMQDDGVSSKFINRIHGINEIFKSFKKNNMKVNYLYYVSVRYFPKLFRKFF